MLKKKRSNHNIGGFDEETLKNEIFVLGNNVGGGGGGGSGERNNNVAQDPMMENNNCNCGRHMIGCLLILPLLIFHFLCFLVIFSMGIGVGILSSILHEIWWDTKFYAFWQTYVTLVTIFIAVEIFFRVGFDTILTNWLNRIQTRHRVELYYIPRGFYFLCYMAAICLLYYSYYSVHHSDIISNNTKSTFDGEGDIDPWKNNPLSLSPTDDQFHYSLIFFIALCFMMYSMSKENDWLTHRRIVMETGEPDPVTRGGIGNFLLALGIHIIMTIIYGLPLVGAVFLTRQFIFPAGVTFFSGIGMGILVGIAALLIERRYPFPTHPMKLPTYAYENHLRIRMAIFQLWLLPFAAGRYFDANRANKLDAQNDDLLLFTVEVSIGIVQAIKIFGNNVFLLKAFYFPPKEILCAELTEDDDVNALHDLNSAVSVVSVAQSTQTLQHEESDPKLIHYVTSSPPILQVEPNENVHPTKIQQDEPKVNVILNKFESNESKVKFFDLDIEEPKENAYSNQEESNEPNNDDPTPEMSLAQSLVDLVESENTVMIGPDSPGSSGKVSGVPSYSLDTFQT